MTIFADAQHRAPVVYAMPESAHIALVEMSYHLELMAALTECGSPASDESHRPVAFAWWFSRMQKDIERIIEASSLCVEQSSPPTGTRVAEKRSI
ncbi:hypothetical protein LF41_1789 [Lysobacter dokdonensis DS-58]|uniref:Uncharacterized protein n=1 Tax=Lysobacter dokdonensis DS-58 TaxID=1300345 RepID=A0A0A2WI52_9GAMM|nr:hypothetical protein [Lysobacter dokdonensis]KGQ17935.1 hypothetical protein LF41_1789 [Lysobacter dokdonensis DS-58]